MKDRQTLKRDNIIQPIGQRIVLRVKHLVMKPFDIMFEQFPFFAVRHYLVRP